GSGSRRGPCSRHELRQRPGSWRQPIRRGPTGGNGLPREAVSARRKRHDRRRQRHRTRTAQGCRVQPGGTGSRGGAVEAIQARRETAATDEGAGSGPDVEKVTTRKTTAALRRHFYTTTRANGVTFARSVHSHTTTANACRFPRPNWTLQKLRVHR